MEGRRSLTGAGWRPALVVAMLVLFGTLAMTGCVIRRALSAPLTPTAGTEEGRALYQRYCAACHGDRGDRIPATPLNSRDFLDLRGDLGLVSGISFGKGVMPAFSSERGGPLSRDQVRSIVAYLNSATRRISPTLLAGEGQAVYQQECATCHGDKGNRVPAAPLGSKPFLDVRSDDQLFGAIADGKASMPPFRTKNRAVLTDDQIQTLVSYLRFNSEIDLADIGLGQALYQKSCLSCHGERGDWVAKVDLGSADNLRRLGDGKLATVIAEQKSFTPGLKPSTGGTFDIPEVVALLAYLKSTAGLPVGTAMVGPRMFPDGRTLFVNNCGGCHGPGGDRVPGVRLKASDYLRSKTDPGLARAVALGTTRGMLAWGQQARGPLSDAQITTIVDYLHFLAGDAKPTPTPAPTPAAAQQSPTAAAQTGSAKPAANSTATASGDPVKGKDVYTQSCASCHGETRDKMPTAKLADGAWLQQRGDAALTQSIANGKGGMPAWGKEKGGKLSAEDIASVLAYLKQAAGGGAAGAGPAAGDPAKGKELFTKSCASCHGETRDKLPTAKLADGAWLQQRGDAALTQSIASGKGGMPAWGKAKGGQLSDEEIASIVAYLKSAAGLAAGPSGGAGAGDPAKGKDVYTQSCASCHGETRDKLPTAKLADGAWLQQRGDAALTQSIASGKGGMPAWGKDKGGKLTADDIANVLAYLKSAAGLAVSSASAPSGPPTPTPTPDPHAKDPNWPQVAVTAEVGRELFQQNCTGCHGQDGLRVRNVPLGSAAWVNSVGKGSLQRRISRGAPGVGMPAWSKRLGGPLSDSQINAITVYLPALGAENAKGGGQR